MSITLDIAFKVFLSAITAACVIDMYYLQRLKSFNQEFTRPAFIQKNLSWVANIRPIRWILGDETLVFMKSRTLWFPATELAFAGLAVASLYTYGFGLAFFRSLIFIYMALMMSIISWKTPSKGNLIPFVVVIPGIIVALQQAYYLDLKVLQAHWVVHWLVMDCLSPCISAALCLARSS
jgi:hypothetical protein